MYNSTTMCLISQRVITRNLSLFFVHESNIIIKFVHKNNLILLSFICLMVIKKYPLFLYYKKRRCQNQPINHRLQSIYPFFIHLHSVSLTTCSFRNSSCIDISHLFNSFNRCVADLPPVRFQGFEAHQFLF